MGYFGININSTLKREFLDLMREAEVRHHSLEELCIHLGALLIGTERNAITDGPSCMDYLFWTDAHNAALSLIPKEGRKAYVIAECIAHEQTQLSS